MTQDGKKPKNKIIASCDFLENELRLSSKKDGGLLTKSVETLHGTRVRKLGGGGWTRRGDEDEFQDVVTCKCDVNEDLQLTLWR